MKTENKKSVVAIAIVAGMALCFLALYHAGERLGEGMQGPSKIAPAPDGTVWVASHGQLHQFTAAGERKRVVALSALGRSSIISELLALSDETLVIAEAEPSAAYRCELDALKCASITSGIAAAAGPTAHALMIAADEKRERFYVSDNAGHRLILVDFEGKVLDITKPGRVLHPNEVYLEKPGELVVVDTDHRRLVRIAVKGDVFGADLWEMKTNSRLLRPSRVLPMDFSRSPDGGWWVLVARDGMKEGDVVLFDRDGKSVKRIDLGAESDPTQIAVLPDGLLVADPTGATLTRVAPGETVVGPWGGAAFQSELDGLRASRSYWRTVRLAAQFLIFAIPLAGILVLWRMGERLTVIPALVVPASPTPVERGIHWLEVRPEIRRRTRWMLVAMTMVMWLTVIGAALLVGAFWGAVRRVDLIVLIPALALCALVPLPLLIFLPRVWRRRLGTDGRDFFLDLGNGKVEKYSFSALATSKGHQLLAGRRLIPLRTGMGSLFPEDELRGYILARIPPSGRVDPLRLMMRALDKGSRELWWALAVIAIALAFLFLPKLFPGLVAYFWNITARLLGAA
jgi:hypothetical protein